MFEQTNTTPNLTGDNNSPGNVSLPDLNQGKNFPFKPVETGERKLSGLKGPVEDILAGTDAGLDNPAEAGVKSAPLTANRVELREPVNVPAMSERPASPMLNQMAPASPIMTEEAVGKTGGSKWPIILLVVLLVAVLGASAVFAVRYFRNKNSNEAAPVGTPSQDLQNLIDVLNQPGGQNNNQTTTEENQNQDLNQPTGSSLDLDNDGLTDELEIERETNPNKFDTDEDGLSDFEEVEIYYTNPTIKDTDGDGYTDGEEVKSGYDPLRGGGARL